MKPEEYVRKIIGAGFIFDSITIDGERWDMVDGNPVKNHDDDTNHIVHEDIYSFLKPSGGIAGFVVDKLVAAGFDTADKLRSATDEDLMSVKGIGSKYVDIIRRALDAGR